jgi:hypothetical protein
MLLLQIALHRANVFWLRPSKQPDFDGPVPAAAQREIAR